MNTIVPIIFGVALFCCGICICILLVQECKALKILKKERYKEDKEEILATLKWFRDEYVSPKQFSSTEQDLDTPARKLLCTMFIDFLEDGKNVEVIEKHKETFFKLIKNAKDISANKI